MPVLWTNCQSESGWEPAPIEMVAPLVRHPLPPAASAGVDARANPDAPTDGVWLVGFHEPSNGARPTWCLMIAGSDSKPGRGAGRRVRVNGRTLPFGLRILTHGDEILLCGAARCVFSEEELPGVKPFPGVATDAVAHCARCKMEIAVGAPAVKCPGAGCGVWVHQEPGRECWTYSESCPLCNRPTALDGGYSWVPDPDE